MALLPSLATVKWNTDKRYLLDLEALGADVVPTAWLTAGASLADVMDERRWERAVVKPTVGAGARGLITVRRAEAAARQEAADALLATGPALMQPFLESVETEGELSLLFAEGELTHAVRKRPQGGDFRVQPEYGGSVALEEPGEAAVDAATRTIDTFTTPPLIARVDLVAGDDDTPLLIGAGAGRAVPLPEARTGGDGALRRRRGPGPRRGHLSSRDRRRSFSTRPPVCSVGQ